MKHRNRLASLAAALTLAVGAASALPAAAFAQDPQDKPVTPRQVAKNVHAESKRVYKRSEKAVRKAGKQTEKQAQRTARQAERTVSRDARREQAAADSLKP